MQMNRCSILAILLVRTLHEAGGRTMNRRELAKAMGISPAYVQQVAMGLIYAGKLTSTFGPNGGYALKPRIQYTYGAILNAMDSPLCPDREDDTEAMREIRANVRRLLGPGLKAKVF